MKRSRERERKGDNKDVTLLSKRCDVIQSSHTACLYCYSNVALLHWKDAMHATIACNYNILTKSKSLWERYAFLFYWLNKHVYSLTHRENELSPLDSRHVHHVISSVSVCVSMWHPGGFWAMPGMSRCGWSWSFGYRTVLPPPSLPHATGPVLWMCTTPQGGTYQE